MISKRKERALLHEMVRMVNDVDEDAVALTHDHEASLLLQRRACQGPETELTPEALYQLTDLPRLNALIDEIMRYLAITASPASA